MGQHLSPKAVIPFEEVISLQEIYHTVSHNCEVTLYAWLFTVGLELQTPITGLGVNLGMSVD